MTDLSNRSAGRKIWIANGIALENNSRLEMPRGITGLVNDGDYYNFYAAVAESVSFSDTSISGLDSICPSGWGLSKYSDTATDKTWGTLIKSYGLNVGDNDTNLLRKTPISISLTGRYAGLSGVFESSGSKVVLTDAFAYGWDNSAYFDVHKDYMYYPGNNDKLSGATVRCVIK